jgi:DNA invertase Pin-like site-specific DNA recombinase
MELGYARVSTTEQDTSLQIAALRAADVVAYWEDQISGVKARPALEELLGILQPGDVVLVYKLDRLARSLTDLLRIAERVATAGATLRSLTEPLETTTPVGRMLFQLLGAFAEFERNVIKERCAAGQAEAMKRGVKFGRKRRKFDYEEAFRMRNEGKTFTELAAHFGVHRSHIFSAVRRIKKERAAEAEKAGASLAGPGSMSSPLSP